MEREEFHKIKGYFGYEVSLNGHVRRTSHGKTTDLDVIQPFGRDVNYVRMKIGKDHKEAKVSYLIALAFLPKERGDVLICMNGDRAMGKPKSSSYHAKEINKNRNGQNAQI